MKRGTRRPPTQTAAKIDPRCIRGLLFDLDGVVTRTAIVHARAWKRVFDEFLRARAEQHGGPFTPFEIETDYRRHVDGKPRYDGVRSFLESRDITLPPGEPSDSADALTICGLGNRKNRYFLQALQSDGVESYDGAVDLIRRARRADLRVAIVTSSKNCSAVLAAANLVAVFDAQVDGNDVEEQGLAGKPAPDMFLEAVRRLDLKPFEAAVFEDALAGVEAGRRGRFALVVGVDRVGRPEALTECGADIVVTDLGQVEIAMSKAQTGGGRRELRHALECRREIADLASGKRLAVFLDYDGTLTPIVDRPDLAVLSPTMRETVRALARVCAVAVVSGRDRRDVEALVGLEGLFYAGSHGFDIAGPDGRRLEYPEAAHYVDRVREAAGKIEARVGRIPGALVETKRYAVATHYRLVEPTRVPEIHAAVDAVAAEYPDLRVTGGKKVCELRPRLDWDKGKAVDWLLRALDLDSTDVLPFYLGDDETDEDAFAALTAGGVGVLVAAHPHRTHAAYFLTDPVEVQEFLGLLAEIAGRRAP